MGTHPIFESDFDCLTDKKPDFVRWSTCLKRGRPSPSRLTSIPTSRLPSIKPVKLRCMPRLSVVTIASSLDMVVGPSPCFTKRLKPLKRSFFDLNAPSPRRRLLVIKRCKHFELGGDKKRKGQMIQF